MSAVICSVCQFRFAGTALERGSVCPQCGARQADQPVPQTGTQPNLLIAAGIGILCGFGFYSLGPLLLFRDTSIYHLFCGHGWVPYALVLLFFVALWSLLLKLPLIQREWGALGLGLLPEDLDGTIEPADGKQMLGRIARLTPRQRSLMAVTRIRQALLRFNQLGTAEKLDDLLRYRADADAMAIDSSYALPKFIIWAIPVLGFVGTVLGISNGVQAFSTLIQNAADLEGLRESLKGVTYGLGQAFETTMIALCMSLFLMFVMSILQRREDRLMAALDDYCMEHLLHKIHVVPVSPAGMDLTSLTTALRDLTEQCSQLQAVQEAALRQTTAAPGGAGSKVR